MPLNGCHVVQRQLLPARSYYPSVRGLRAFTSSGVDVGWQRDELGSWQG